MRLRSFRHPPERRIDRNPKTSIERSPVSMKRDNEVKTIAIPKGIPIATAEKIITPSPLFSKLRIKEIVR